MSFSSDPTYPLYPVFAFLGFVLALVPLPWHLQAWNAGTCAYMLWASLSCLIGFVNSIVWNNNVSNVAPVWCDISSKFLLGAGVGIPAASLCISRRLYNIAAVQTVSVTLRDKRRALIGDLCIAVGIPVLVMILHYVVQGHRFDILEDVGCYPTIYNTLAAYFLVFMWPVLLGSISFVYAALTLHAFWQRRLQFSEFLSSNSSMNVSRYLRLMLLALIEMLCTVPLGTYSIYIANNGVELAPWISWSNVHFNFSRVGLIPALIWRSEPSYLISVELTRWLYPFCALLFFALFGFAGEAQKNYRVVFWFVARRFGVEPPVTRLAHSGPKSWRATPKPNPMASVGSLPVYVPRNSSSTKGRSDSLTSSFGCNDLDVEKAAGLDSPALPQYEKEPRISVCAQVHTPPDFDEISLREHSSDIHAPVWISDSYPSSRPTSPIFAQPPSPPIHS